MARSYDSEPWLGAMTQSYGYFSKLLAFLKFTNTDPFAAWFVLTEDAIPDGKRVV